MARKALGRGLDALIPARDEGGGGGEGVTLCDVGDISPGRLQPRKDFDKDSLAELAASIKSQGILQPLLVRPRKSGGFELIAGERRLRAAKAAGLARVPILIKDADDKTALELSLIENIQREDLDPIEEAEAFKRLMTEFDYTQEGLSKRVGKDRATIANLLRLLNLPGEIRDDLRKGRISAGHARAILMAGTEKAMLAIRDAAVNDGISVREAERLAQARKISKGPSAGKRGPARPGGSVHVRDMEERLLRELGTRVKIITAGKGGRIEIQFFSAEDLGRIYRQLIGGR
jgi:ParB family chromosome partitioning protein